MSRAKVIERALAAGVRMRSLFMEEKWLDQTMPLVDSLLDGDPDFPVLVATREQFRALTGYEVTRGALAAFERPPLPRVEDLLASARRVAVLEDVTNYTNIGAVFRSAAALGIDAVLGSRRRATTRCTVAPRACRWGRCSRCRGRASEASAPGRPRACRFCARWASRRPRSRCRTKAIFLHDERLRGCDKLALVLGTEGDGLAPSTIANCDYTVKIPMDHDVDSLNVAAASAVAFWELRTKWRD